MARKARAPRHDLGHKMRYVPPRDGAWRHDMIDREIEELRDRAAKDHEIAVTSAKRDGLDPPSEADEADDAADGHPYLQYMSGLTRWDLTDNDLGPYLDFEGHPEIWTIRRLSFELRTEVGYLLRAGRDEEANWKAFYNGVMALEGTQDDEGQKLAGVVKDLKAKRPPGKQADKLRTAVAAYAMAVVHDVGMAVYQGSMDLTEAEGKPSASPPGD